MRLGDVEWMLLSPSKYPVLLKGARQGAGGAGGFLRVPNALRLDSLSELQYRFWVSI